MKKKLLALILALCLIVGIVPPASATEEIVKSGSFGENVTWDLYADGTLVFSGTGPTEDSEKYTTEAWHTALATVKHVVFEEGITYIGKNLFAGQRGSVFKEIETVTIPSTVKEIGEDAFSGLVGLYAVYINDLKNWCSIKFQDDGANPLQNHAALYVNGKEITHLVIPSSVTEIAPYAFMGCNSIHTVTIPSSVKKLGSFAFNTCSCLAHMIFEGGAVTMDKTTFTLSSLKAYYPAGYSSWNSVVEETFNDAVTWVSYRGKPELVDDRICNRINFVYDNDTFTLTLFGTGHTGTYTASSLSPTWDTHSSYTHNLVVEEGITELGDYSFQEFIGLQSVTLPESLTAIHQKVFYRCSVLEEVDLPSNLSYIGPCAFENTAITSVTIPEAMTEIGTEAFYNCDSLSDVVFHDNITSIGRSAFASCNTLSQVTLPAHLEALGEKAFADCPLESVTVPASLLTYGKQALSGAAEIIFTGRAPTFDPASFQDQTVTVYYPKGYSTWTSGVRKQYGGNVTWVAYETEIPEPEKHTHSYGQWIVWEAPTVLSGGEERSYCDCGLYQRRTVSKLSNPFSDVKENAFYYDPVMWALANGVTSGTDATHFSPDQTCTRGQVVTFLWRAAGCPEPTITENPFSDVAEGTYCYKAVLWAVENGITSGVSATRFAPDAACTRAQVVTFLWRAMGKPEPTSAQHPFTDAKENTFYYQAMLWAVENGITSGVSATSFAPDKNCTRGQVVTFLYRTYE